MIACGRYACGDPGCFWNHTDKRHFTLYDDRIANDIYQSSFAPLAQVPALLHTVTVYRDQRGVQESPPIPLTAEVGSDAYSSAVWPTTSCAMPKSPC